MLLGKPTIAVGRKWAVDFISDGETGLIVDYEMWKACAAPFAGCSTIRRRHGAWVSGRDHAASFTTQRTMQTVHELVKQPEVATTSPLSDSGHSPLHFCRSRIMTTNTAELISSARVARTAPERGRILIAMRWPLGGIRTHLLYNAPIIHDRGYRFTFVGPDDASFDTLTRLSQIIPVLSLSVSQCVANPVIYGKVWRTELR